MKNNKGFTLAEVLAVIVILAIIGLITIPIYNNIINNSKKQTYTDSMHALINELERYVISDISSKYTSEVSITSLDLELNNHNITSGNFYVNNSFITLVNVTNDDYCANGNKNNLIITTGNCN